MYCRWTCVGLGLHYSCVRVCCRWTCVGLGLHYACVLQVDVCKLRRRCEGWHVLSFVHGHLGDDDDNDAHAVVSLPPRFESILTVEYPWMWDVDMGCGHTHTSTHTTHTWVTSGVTYGVAPEHQMSYYGDCGFNGDFTHIHLNTYTSTHALAHLTHSL